MALWLRNLSNQHRGGMGLLNDIREVAPKSSEQGRAKMLKPKKRIGGQAGFANGTWRIFDAQQLSWIALAIAGLVLFAYMTG